MITVNSDIPYQPIGMDGCDDGKVNGVAFKCQDDAVAKPTKTRLVEKNGIRNVRSKKIPSKRYMQDVFTTLIDAKWKWVILMFLTVYLGQWTFFGFVWWIIMVAHGKNCFDNVNNFTEAFLLSVESSMTIGYGSRQISSECSEVIVLFLVQALSGLLVDAVIIGIIFTKIARPSKRQSTIIFSQNATVTKRDDKYAIMFRVADVRKRQLSECHVRMYLYRTYKTLEGRVLPNHQDQMRVGCDWTNIRDDSDRLFLLSPVTVSHVVDRKSPFYGISADMFMRLDWEIVVVLEGIVEATGSTMQARTSYLMSEIYWGYEFLDVLTTEEWEGEESMQYKIKKLDDKEPVSYVPRCSPKEYYKQINKDPEPNDVVGEQDELWDDENFIPPSEENRVLPSHKHLNGSAKNIVL